MNSRFGRIQNIDRAPTKGFGTEVGVRPVFCVHPLVLRQPPCDRPVFYPEKEEVLFRNWNAPPHLFLVGHKHDYERRSLDEEGNNPPVHIISGSGGAPLETRKKPYCDDEKTHQFKKWYNYCRVTINAEKISIIVFGCKKIKEPFTQIEKLEFQW